MINMNVPSVIPQWKIITGTAKEVQDELNSLQMHGTVVFNGISSTNEQTTVCITFYEHEEL